MAKIRKKKNSFTETEIPDNYDTDEKKRDFLIEDIEEKFSSLADTEGNATDYKIHIGQRLNVLKKILKRMDFPFVKYLNKNLPYVVRSAQRWMRLAKHVDSDNYPKLTLLGDTRLLALIGLAKKGNQVHKYLKQQNVSLDFNEYDPSEAHNFREEVQALINKKQTKPQISLKKALSNLKKTLHTYSSKIQSLRKDDDTTNSVLVKNAIEEAEELIANLKRLHSDEGKSSKPIKKKAS